MTSIERTAYPQFKRLTSARVLHVFFTPAAEEVAWARERTASPEALLALVLDLKCFQKMARFCSREEIPEAVTDHVRRCLGLGPEAEPDHGAARTAKWHRRQVRVRQGVTYDQRRARAVAAAAIREAALVKNHPPDLINVALERLVEASLELPAFSTLDELAAAIRAEVNAGIFAGIVSRMGPEGRQRMRGLLTTAGLDGRSMFNRLKKPAQRATWSRFKAQAGYLDQVDELGDTAAWLEGVAPGKVADFAGEAAAQDIDTLSRYEEAKRLALVACLVHTARMRARDDLAEMLCKRMAAIVKKARAELEEIRLRQRETSERLIGTYRTVLEHLDPDGETASQAPGQEAARAVAAVEEAGGFAAQLAGIEEVSAFHGDNYEVLVHRFFRKDRAVMFELAGKLELVATSSDASVLAALEHARAYHAMRRDFIPLPPAAGGDDAESGLAFASGNWRRAVTDRRHPGMVVRRHFEAMVFTYLAGELRTGDIAVTGAGEYADWRANLLPWSECEPLLEGFCAEAGLPATAAGFTEQLRHAHLDAAAALDAGYEDNADLVIGEDGVPSLKRRRSAGTPQAAEKLAEAIGPADAGAVAAVDRGPYRLLAGLAPPLRPGLRLGSQDLRSAGPVLHGGVHRRGQHRPVRGGPAHRRGIGAGAVDGAQPAHRPEQAQRRDRDRGQRLRRAGRGQGVGGRHRGGRRRHPGGDLHRQPAGRDLDPVRGRGRDRVPLRLRHLRGAVLQVHPGRGVGGGAPDRGPAGQQLRHPALHRARRHARPVSFPVFTLATLFGFDLMPRIRNFKDLIFFRASEHLIYPHIDELFGERGRNVIDWPLIERHWRDLMQVAISISEGRLSSATLMRRLRSNSRKNRIYKVFREVGRSVRTVALLRYLADPRLRARITAATNKVESYHGFAQWLSFGNNGVLADNDPAEQEKLIKLNTLLANLVIFHNALDIMDVVRGLVAEGWTITADQLGALSPYLRAHISRFGAYATDELTRQPEAFNPVLKEVDFTALRPGRLTAPARAPRTPQSQRITIIIR